MSDQTAPQVEERLRRFATECPAPAYSAMAIEAAATIRVLAVENAHLRSALMGAISGPQYEILAAERDALRKAAAIALASIEAIEQNSNDGNPTFEGVMLRRALSTGGGDG